MDYQYLACAIRAALTTLDVHDLSPGTGCCEKCGTPGWCGIHDETARWLEDLREVERTVITSVSASDATVSFARFLLVRDNDVTGLSGTGVIADGAAWETGRSVLVWRGETTRVRQAEYFDHWNEISTVHGHGGTTRIAWIDPPPRVLATCGPYRNGSGP